MVKLNGVDVDVEEAARVIGTPLATADKDGERTYIDWMYLLAPESEPFPVLDRLPA